MPASTVAGVIAAPRPAAGRGRPSRLASVILAGLVTAAAVALFADPAAAQPSSAPTTTTTTAPDRAAQAASALLRAQAVGALFADPRAEAASINLVVHHFGALGGSVGVADQPRYDAVGAEMGPATDEPLPGQDPATVVPDPAAHPGPTTTTTAVEGFEMAPDIDDPPPLHRPTFSADPSLYPAGPMRSYRVLPFSPGAYQTGAVRTGGGLTCPIVGPLAFINDWGFPRSGGRTHKGNDLFAPSGTPIVATADGEVTGAGSGGLGGLSVTVTTTGGDRWYNAHLLSLAPGIAKGMAVSAGQVVGYVGNSGNAISTPPHNHIQWHPGGGAPENPYFILRAACG